eukprot:scaffold11428_cov105-Isochrysis_galbana.AAC.14
MAGLASRRHPACGACHRADDPRFRRAPGRRGMRRTVVADCLLVAGVAPMPSRKARVDPPRLLDRSSSQPRPTRPPPHLPAAAGGALPLAGAESDSRNHPGGSAPGVAAVAPLGPAVGWWGDSEMEVLADGPSPPRALTQSMDSRARFIDLNFRSS